MPALIERDTALQQTGRGQFRNIPAGGTHMQPVAGNRSGAYVNPTNAQRGSGNSYVNRARGGALRDDYGQMGAEASALSAGAPGAESLMAPNTGQQIRGNAIASAYQQTMQHYNIRRGMAEDADRAAALWNDQVTTLAELALKGQMHKADQVLKERSLELDAQQVEQTGEYQKGQLGLGKQELKAKKEDSTEDRKLKQAELDQNKTLETQKLKSEANRSGAEIREKQEDRKLAREGLEVDKAYKQGIVQNKQQGTADARRKALMDAQAKGVDISAFADEMGDGGGGTAGGGALTEGTAVTQPPKPDPNAEWDEDLNSWVLPG